MNKRIIFECLGFFSTPVFYRLECGYLYQFGSYYEHKGFEPHEGFLPRDKTLPVLPTKEEVESEYNLRFEGKAVINPDGIVYAG
jgi:hypothetical protein